MTEKMTWSDDDLQDGRQRARVNERKAGRTRRLLIVGVTVAGLVAATAVGSAVTWLLVGEGEQQGAAPPLIKADENPIKIHPEDPGGMEVQNRDKLVYSRLRGEREDGVVERILPQPEQPVRPPLPDASTSSGSDPLAEGEAQRNGDAAIDPSAIITSETGTSQKVESVLPLQDEDISMRLGDGTPVFVEPDPVEPESAAEERRRNASRQRPRCQS
ncbi:MAG: hypothetical protein HC826_01290 [Rhodospirillales bacterium]|nr:hypothetical protein [Rhodospirillales bacterium]